MVGKLFSILCRRCRRRRRTTQGLFMAAVLKTCFKWQGKPVLPQRHRENAEKYTIIVEQKGYVSQVRVWFESGMLRVGG